MDKKVALRSLGCKVNAYETEAMGEMLSKRGYQIVSFEEKADIYIVNTCTVTNIADRKSRQMLHKAKKKNPEALVVAVGCYAQAAGKELQLDPAIDIVVGNDKKKQIVEIIENEVAFAWDDINDISNEAAFETLNIERMDEHTRAYMKIQDGCNQFCSYCIIPYARGRIRSRSLEDIKNEAVRLAEAGYKEVVLTGIHLSSYGREKANQDAGITLVDAIRCVHETKGIERVRLGSLEPRIITEEFMQAISQMDSFCPQFHLSLQSGCDETLKRMNRKYTTQEYLEGVERIRKYYRDAAITTDIIVGFPQETEEEFETTMQFAKKVQFAKIHVFKYSKREGTVAEKMEGQVPDQIKAARSDALIELEESMAYQYHEQFLGREVEVLLEETMNVDGESYLTGFTKEYVRVAVKISGLADEEKMSNSIVKMKLVKMLNHEIVLAEI